MDFEINLFFFLTKVMKHFKFFSNFFNLAYIITIERSYREKKEKTLSVRPTPHKNKKNVLCVYYMFQGILSIFQKPVKRLGSGLV